MTEGKISDAELRILTALEPAGAVCNRYGHVVAEGKIVAHQGSCAPLRLVARGLIEGDAADNHLRLTPLGRSALKGLKGRG